MFGTIEDMTITASLSFLRIRSIILGVAVITGTACDRSDAERTDGRAEDVGAASGVASPSSSTVATAPPSITVTEDPPMASATSPAESIGTANQSTQPAVPDLEGRIVFTRAGGRYGDETVFAANADGTGQRQLSQLGAACCPWATRDGSRVLMAASAPGDRVTVATVSFDGSGREVLALPNETINLGPGPFSPDGSEVAFEGFDTVDESRNGIYVGAPNGSELRQITRNGGIPGDWSPDGEQIVFFRGPQGDPPRPGSLFVIGVDGSGERQLTPGRVAVQCCFNYRWSPDGSRVLFADTDGVLWTIAADGSELTELFKDAEGRYAITPTWSPDGSHVMFGLDLTPNPFSHPPNGLYVVAADGTGLTLVIGGDDFKRTPYWVP